MGHSSHGKGSSVETHDPKHEMNQDSHQVSLIESHQEKGRASAMRVHSFCERLWSARIMTSRAAATRDAIPFLGSIDAFKS